MPLFSQLLEDQHFSNGYELVDGVAMHAANGDNFRIPPDVIKRHVSVGQFIELRIDSPRFSVHEDDAEQCCCPSCNGSMTKPILRHEHPATLVPLPDQEVPSRGWGEDFWVQVAAREDDFFRARIDNPLVENRLHELSLGDEIYFHTDHVLAVHGSHRLELMTSMNAAALKELAQWLGQQNE